MFVRWKNRRRAHDAAANRRLTRRCPPWERLESRRLLATAEGTPFSFNEAVDASQLIGSLSASVDWGDGTVTPADVIRVSSGSLVSRVDYSYDTANFFNSQLKKDLFQQAVDTILSRLGDDLAAIMPNAGNTWTADFSHPATGQLQTISNMHVSENEIVIFAGGRELGTTLAVGGPGGFNVTCSVASFCETVATRGEPGARSQAGSPLPTDFGPWGGSVAFDTSTDFHFSPSTADLDAQQSDFLSVAMHEVAHLLGFGTAPSWTTYVSGNVYIGPASRLANGNQSVPLSSGESHWANDTLSDGQEAALSPSLTTGTRRLLTTLDYAGLDDVGWELVDSTATISSSHTFADDGVYDIVVNVVGSIGGIESQTLQELITNVPPTLTPASDQAVAFGQPFTITNLGSFSDPGFGANETFDYTIDWGDGSALGSGMASIDIQGGEGVTTRGSYDGDHTYANGGVYDVILTIADDDGGVDTATMQITVAEGLSVDIAAELIAENDGVDATTVTITRHSNDLSQPLIVNLMTDTTELDIPESIEFAAGESVVVLMVNAVDDDLLDGTQIVRITATANGFRDGTDSLIVVDHETLTLTFDVATVLESTGSAAATATLTRSNTNIDSALEVLISIDDETEASSADVVIIAVGEQSIEFPVNALGDGLDDGPQLVTVTASANGYEPGVGSFFVADTLAWHNAALRWDVDGDKRISPIDVLQVFNDLNRRGSRVLSAPEQTDVPPYLDVNNDGHISPIDALLIINFINNGSVAEGEARDSTRLACRIADVMPGSVHLTAVHRDDRQRIQLSSEPKLEREVVFLSHQFRDPLADDLVADVVAAFDRFA